MEHISALGAGLSRSLGRLRAGGMSRFGLGHFAAIDAFFPMAVAVALPLGGGMALRRDSIGLIIMAKRAGVLLGARFGAGSGLGHFPITECVILSVGLNTAGADLADLPMAGRIADIINIYMVMLFAFVSGIPMLLPLAAAYANPVLAACIQAVCLAAFLAKVAVAAYRVAFAASILTARADGGAILAHAAAIAHGHAVTAVFAATVAKLGAALTAIAALAAAVLGAFAAVGAMSAVFNAAFMAHTAIIAPVIGTFAATVAVAEAGIAFLIASLAVRAMHSFINGTAYALIAVTAEAFDTV